MASDVFLSHKSDDKPRIQPLLDGLLAAGLSVWWDRDTPGGALWRRTIEAELDAARCVLVCWSDASVVSEWVLEEAERAKARGVLLPLRIDAVEAPFGFAGRQVLDLVGWRGDLADPRWERLLAQVRAVVEGREVHALPPVPPKPPPTRWPRRAAAGGIALALAAGLGWQQRADPAEAAAWQALVGKEAGGQALQRADWQGYLQRFSQGRHAEEARRRLAACRDEPVVSWQRQDDRLPLAVPAERGVTEAAARAVLAPVLADESQRSCAPYAKDPERHRLLGSQADPAGVRCERRSDGAWRCGFDGQVTCALELRSTTTREVCP